MSVGVIVESGAAAEGCGHRSEMGIPFQRIGST